MCKMENEKIKISQKATNDADLLSREIPSLDLYLDQIIFLISEKNSLASECYKDKNLTKMMVNNYAKGGLIDPPNGKKYSKTHIVQMLVINRLKSLLSMSEIKQLLDGIKGDGRDIIELYDDFLEEKDSLRENASLMIDNVVNSGDEANAVFTLLTLSEYFRSAAKLIIDEKYPLPEEEKNEKTDKADKADKKENKKESKKKGEA